MGEWGATLVVLGEVAILRPNRGWDYAKCWISLRETSPGDNLSTVAGAQTLSVCQRDWILISSGYCYCSYTNQGSYTSAGWSLVAQRMRGAKHARRCRSHQPGARATRLLPRRCHHARRLEASLTANLQELCHGELHQFRSPKVVFTIVDHEYVSHNAQNSPVHLGG
jgi:hypothetical protein